jgi:hypothetical protein
MAAGQGFKTFTTGEVLTAGDVNGYLMQGVLVFASAAARDAAITSPQEGQFAFTKDTNGLWYYDGAAWVSSGATGDIEGVTAGVGISGGGTSGTVTVTNSMATAITTNGDLIYGTGSGTFSRLGIGSSGQVLNVSAGVPAWSTPSSGGGMTLLSTTTLSGATTTISSISGSYKTLYAVIYGVTNNTTEGLFSVEPNATNNITGLDYIFAQVVTNNTLGPIYLSRNASSYYPDRTNANNAWALTIDDYASTTHAKSFNVTGGYGAGGLGGNIGGFTSFGAINTNSAISSLVFRNAGGTFSAGTVLLYGVS